MKKKKAKQPPARLRGAARMRQQGYRYVQVWLDKSELALIQEQAQECRMPLATYLRAAALWCYRESVPLTRA